MWFLIVLWTNNKQRDVIARDLNAKLDQLTCPDTYCKGKSQLYFMFQPLSFFYCTIHISVFGKVYLITKVEIGRIYVV